MTLRRGCRAARTQGGEAARSSPGPPHGEARAHRAPVVVADL